jgi:hypothetical protein
MRVNCLPPLVALLLAVGCGGSRAWTPADAAWQGAVTVSLGADYLTTRSALDDGWVEENPIMGDGPDRISPEVYFPTVAVLSAGAAAALPGRWRRVLQIATVGFQSFIVARNVHRGAGFGFSF